MRECCDTHPCLFLPSNCVHILAHYEINGTHGVGGIEGNNNTVVRYCPESKSPSENKPPPLFDPYVVFLPRL